MRGCPPLPPPRAPRHGPAPALSGRWKSGVVSERPDVVVVGGGVAGLVAARELSTFGMSVLLLESSPLIGGKLRLAEVGGVRVDIGAESMLARRPEAVGLVAELGLDVVHPAAGSAQIWTRGALRPLPRTLFGAPLDLDALAATGVLSDDGLARARARDGPAAGGRATCRSPSCSGRGWATRWSTGWRSRCSAGSTPAMPTICRRGHGAEVVAMLREHGSLRAAVAALPPPPGVAIPGVRRPVGGLGRLPARARRDRRRGGPHLGDRPPRGAHGDRFRLTVGSTPTRGRGDGPSRHRRPGHLPRGCSPTSRRRRRTSWVRSSTPRWR